MSDKLKKEILEGINTILDATKILGRHILLDLKNMTLWIDNGEGGFGLDHDKLIYSLLHIKYDRNLTPQETYSCTGAIAATQETLVLIRNINNAKDTFRGLVKEVRQQLQQRPGKWVQDVLAQGGHGVIKLKHVYRHIPSVPYHPTRISWTKGKNGTSKGISLAEAKNKLHEFGENQSTDIQLAKLSLLREQDKLVVYHPIRPHWLVNVSRTNTEGYTVYQKLTTSLPLFYLHDDTLPPPWVGYATERPRTHIRGDKQIDDVPFLQSIHAYTYRK